MSDDLRHIENQLDELKQDVHELRKEINTVRLDLERYRGAIGAVLLFATVIITAVKMLWGFIKTHISWS